MGALTRTEIWRPQGGILKRINRDTVPDRSILVWGVDKPTVDSTGVLPNITRTTRLTPLTLNTAGNQLFENIDFMAKVTVQSSGTKTFRNCTFASNGGANAMLQCTSAAVSDVQCYDCTLRPTTPDVSYNAVQGHHFQMYRCQFVNCVDMIRIHNTNAGQGAAATGVIIQQCLTRLHFWSASDPNQSDGSHTDGIQIEGGAGTVIRGNYFNSFHDKSLIAGPPYSRQGYLGSFSGNAKDDTLARATTCIIGTPNVGAITGLTVAKNWFAGGEIQCNFGNDNNAGNDLGSFTDNRFERNSYFTGHTLDFQNGATFVATGNVYDDDGTAVTVRTNA